MFVLGIDPGSTNMGWALLNFTVLTAPVWYAGGRWDGKNPRGLFGFAPIEKFRPGLVVVEQPRAMHDFAANVQVMGTSWAGGRVMGIAEERGFDVLPLGVTEWRTAFVGVSRRGENVDVKVERALRAIVRQCPDRWNSHARDAGGVACVGARHWAARWRERTNLAST